MSLLTRKLSVFSVFTACAALLAAVLPGTANADQAKQDAVLDEIIVVASKIEIPRRQLGAAVSTIDAEEIELRGYFSIADVLRTQPGIAVSSNGGIGTTTSVRVRGEEAFRTQVFIDGIKASDPSAPQVSPNFDNLLTTSDMQRIEVLRGPQGFIYGADAGGVVSITTRRGDGPLTGRFAAEGGEFGTRRLEGALSGGNDSADFFLSVTDLDTDGFNTRPSDVTLGDDDGYDNTVLHGKFGWQATDNLRLQLVARSSDGETEFDGCGFPTTSDCLDASEETALRLSAELVAGAFSHELSVSRLETDRENLANGTFAFGSEGELQRIEYTGSFVLNDATTFVFGVDHQEEETDASGSDLDRDQTGIYAEYQGSFGDSWFVSAGARYDDNDDFGSFTSIRLSAAYLADIGDAGVLRYRASVGTGFRAPSLFEVAYNAGPFAFPPAAGTTLEEEQTEGYDIGVDWIAETGARIGIGWFDQEVD
ncbi:MAG: TonB-dependent receptor, partial [Pseudomonadota bacterium]